MIDFKNISDRFQFDGRFLEAHPYGTGHINDTYAATFERANGTYRYIIQRINHEIFKNPVALMDNIVRVTEHVRGKLVAEGARDVSRRTMTVIPTRESEPCLQDDEGNFWRAYHFVENARTYDILENIDQAYEAARAFGLFQKMLVDLPEPPLIETIPDFHNGPKRFAAFQRALEADSQNRAASAKPEIDFAAGHAWIFDVLPGLVEEGRIPLRTTHNDTKINNVMLDDETGEGLCVIDLDTVMPGLSLYDFGDIVRTSTSPAAEDERDLSKVVMEMPRFEAVLRGYLSTAGEFLNPTEREQIVLSGKMLTFIIGIRFLSDHLDGDRYFKTHREAHNLDRARAQFKLIQSMEEHEEEMLALVEKIQ